MKEFTIKSHEAGQKLDKYLMRVLDQAPKSFVYKMLRKKNIVLNDKKADGHEVLKEKDNIKIYFSDETFDKFSTFNSKAGLLQSDTNSEYRAEPPQNQVLKSDQTRIPEILYEDDDILILNKPAGLLSQKAVPSDYSANDFVLEYLQESGQLTKEDMITFRPSICNRLDRNTSGLLIAGKSMRGLQQMSEQLKSRSMQKFYRCLVLGTLKKDAHLTGYLTKDHVTNQVKITEQNPEKNGNYLSAKIKSSEQRNKDNYKSLKKHADKAAFIETAYHPIAQYNGITLLEVHLITGRSHQIRAHLASIGHPILGDGKYGNEKVNRKLRKELGVTGQLLHAYRMEFPDGRVLTAKEPEIFSKVIEAKR